MTVSIAAWMLPREDRVPSVRSRSRSSRRVLRFIRSVRSSSSSTKPVMPPSGPRNGATRTCNSCSPRTVVATCDEVAESCSMRSRACASRSRSMMPKTERPRPTARVIAQHRPRRGVVEQDLPVDVAHDDRRGEFGHQRGQPVPLLREARLRGANLRVDLPFGHPAPLGQVVHRGGQLREFGGSRPVQPVFGVGLEEQPGLGGQPPRRHGVATHQTRHRRDESGDNQRCADQQRGDLACDCVDHGVPLISGDAAPQQKRDRDNPHDNIGRDRHREQPATLRPSSAHLNRRRSGVG